MPIDTSIYNSLIQPPKSLIGYTNELDQADLAKAQLQSANLNLIGQQQDYQDQQKLRQLYAQPGFDPNKAENLPSIFAISPKAGAAAQKSMLDAQKAQADIGHLQAQTGQANQATAASQFEVGRKKLETAMQIVTTANDPAAAHAGFQQAVQQGLMTPEEAAAKEREVPSDPQGFQQWRQSSALALLSAKDRFDLAEKQQQQAETARHNKASEGIQVRGQNMVDARERDRQAQDASMPRGVVTQTNDGPMLVDPRTGQAKPVMDASGQPVGPKMKDIPQSVVTAYVGNQTAVNKIDQAIAEVKANPDAFGLTNYLGDTIKQRTDPQGVKPRAIISDIGSLKIHDRTGAAMSVAEAARLKPFIPTATDSAEAILTKLENLKTEYANKNGGIEDYYNTGMGFKALPGGKAPPAADVPDDIAAILKKHGGK